MKHKLALSLWILFVSPVAFAQPTITGQPTDQTANQGYSGTFHVFANGSSPLSYAWFFNQLAIAGAAKILKREVDPKAHADLLAEIEKQL